MIGDLLISSTFENKNISLPTFFRGLNDILETTGNLHASSIEQKLYIISHNLAIGLAGLVYERKIFLTGIQNNFRFIECTWENIERFLNEYLWDADFCDSSLLLLYHDRRVFQTYNRNCRQAESLSFGKILFSGTGSQTFVDTVNLHTIAAETTTKIRENHPENPLEIFFARNIILLTKFLVGEKMSLETLLAHWGAGFEMVFWGGDKLEKLHDIGYILVLAQLDVTTRALSITPILIHRYNYVGNLLFLTAYDCQLEELKTFSIPPINEKPGESTLTEVPEGLSLKANGYSLTMGITYSSGEYRNTSFLTPGDKINLEVSTKEVGKHNIKIEIDRLFLNLFVDFALKDLLL